MQTSSKEIRSFLAWIWAVLLVGAGTAVLVNNFGLLPTGGGDSLITLLIAGGLLLLAFPFIVRWLVRRDEWWALILSWVFFAISLFLGVIYLDLPYPQIAVMVLIAEITLPFAVVYFMNKQRLWALITAYALVIAGCLLALTMLGISVQMLGAIALLAVAMPFWVIYIADRQAQWWAIIPAGALSAIGAVLMVVLAMVQPASQTFYIILNGVLAGVFLALWLAFRRLDWSLWVMIGFVIAAVLSYWFPTTTTWAIQALVMGLYIAYRQIKPAAQQIARQTSSPPAAAVQTAPAPAAPPPAATATPPQSVPNPPVPPPVSASPITGTSPAAADAAATRAAQESGIAPVQRSPLEGFRPLDPLKDRKADEED